MEFFDEHAFLPRRKYFLVASQPYAGLKSTGSCKNFRGCFQVQRDNCHSLFSFWKKLFKVSSIFGAVFTWYFALWAVIEKYLSFGGISWAIFKYCFSSILEIFERFLTVYVNLNPIWELVHQNLSILEQILTTFPALCSNLCLWLPLSYFSLENNNDKIMQ